MKTILIVDDQKSILITLEAILKKEGHIVISCTNSIDAYDRFTQENIDLMITDAIMPMGTSGYSLISTIRQGQKNNAVPIIMLTGKREATDIEKAIQVGANDYMVKPIDPDILLTKVNNLITKTQSRSEFIEAPVLLPAHIQAKNDIISVSEVGVTLHSNLQLVPGQIYKLNSDFFKQLEIEQITIRVLSSEPLSKDSPGLFKQNAQFIGLSEKELGQLRNWIRNKLKQIKN